MTWKNVSDRILLDESEIIALWKNKLSQKMVVRQ